MALTIRLAKGEQNKLDELLAFLDEKTASGTIKNLIGRYMYI